MIGLHYRPERMLMPELAGYPAHLHIDLLPDYQGKGYGRALMQRMFAALADDGAPSVYVGMVTANTGAVRSTTGLGFTSSTSLTQVRSPTSVVQRPSYGRRGNARIARARTCGNADRGPHLRANPDPSRATR